MLDDTIKKETIDYILAHEYWEKADQLQYGYIRDIKSIFDDDFDSLEDMDIDELEAIADELDNNRYHWRD